MVLFSNIVPEPLKQNCFVLNIQQVVHFVALSKMYLVFHHWNDVHCYVTLPKLDNHGNEWKWTI